MKYTTKQQILTRTHNWLFQELLQTLFSSVRSRSLFVDRNISSSLRVHGLHTVVENLWNKSSTSLSLMLRNNVKSSSCRTCGWCNTIPRIWKKKCIRNLGYSIKLKPEKLKVSLSKNMGKTLFILCSTLIVVDEDLRLHKICDKSEVYFLNCNSTITLRMSYECRDLLREGPTCDEAYL